MSWGALIGSVVSGFLGDRASKRATDSELASTQAIIDANNAAEQRTFDRAVPLYDAQFDNRNMAGQTNLDILNNLYPAIGNTVQDGSMQAQRLTQGGLGAGINSILGIGNPTDTSWMDPYQVQSQFRNNYALPDFIKPSEALAGVTSGDNSSTGPGGTPGYDPGIPGQPMINDAMNQNSLVSQSGSDYRNMQPLLSGQTNFSNNDIVNNMMRSGLADGLAGQPFGGAFNDWNATGMMYNNGQITRDNSWGPDQWNSDPFQRNFEGENLITGTDDPMEFLANQESNRLRQQRQADTHRQNLVNISLAPLLSGYQDPTFSLSGNRTQRQR